MTNPEFMRQMFSYSLYPIPLGCVMSRGNEGYARLAGHVNDAFGNFPCNERIHTQPDGFFEIILSATGTPADMPYRLVFIADYQRLTGQNSTDMGAQFFQAHRRP